MRRVQVILFALVCASLTTAAAAQSPNTATILVSVSDQTGASLTGARVVATNNETGATREAASGPDGRAAIPALSLTGAYTVDVSKQGFAAEQVNDLTLRAGETATVRVKLLVGTEHSAVTVYGTVEGIRADPQLGRRLDSPTIDETPLLGRKVTNLPLLNAAFRPARGTGDLFVNATYFVTGAGGRRAC